MEKQKKFEDDNVKEFYERIFDCSIDKLVVVGDFAPGRLFDDHIQLQNKFDTDPDFKYLASDLYRTSFRLFDDKAYIQVQYGKCVKGRPFRMEFNPNKLSKEHIDKIKNVILPAVKNAKFTRVDIAFDCDYSLAKFMYFEKRPRKKNDYRSPNGALETMYFGTRNSDEQLRIYDKNVESSEGVSKADEETGEIVGKEKVLPKDKEGKEHEVWWRLEFTYKQDKIDRFRDSEFNMFDNYRIVKVGHLDYEKIPKPADRWMVYYMMNNPSEKDTMNYRQRKRFEEYVIGMADVDVTEAFKQKYKEKRADLQFHLSQWMSATTRVFR